MSGPLKARMVVEIDGAEYDLDRCCWLDFSPCGCLSGVAMAGHMPADEDKVRNELTGTQTAIEGKRKVDAGWTLRLVPHQVFVTEWADKFKGDCPHSPKWGIEPDPTSPGFAWGHNAGTYRHLVEADRVADTDFDRDTHKQRERARVTDGPALCGGGGKWPMWTNCHGALRSQTMVCLKCVAAANRIAPQLPTAATA